MGEWKRVGRSVPSGEGGVGEVIGVVVIGVRELRMKKSIDALKDGGS